MALNITVTAASRARKEAKPREITTFLSSINDKLKAEKLPELTLRETFSADGYSTQERESLLFVNRKGQEITLSEKQEYRALQHLLGAIKPTMFDTSRYGFAKNLFDSDVVGEAYCTLICEAQRASSWTVSAENLTPEQRKALGRAHLGNTRRSVGEKKIGEPKAFWAGGGKFIFPRALPLLRLYLAECLHREDARVNTQENSSNQVW